MEDDRSDHSVYVAADPAFAELVRTRIEALRPELSVTTVTEVGTAVDTVEASAVDCAVTDVSVDGTDAIEVIEALRSVDTGLPVIVYAPTDAGLTASEALEAGATDYLTREPGAERYELLAKRIADAIVQRRTTTQLEARERSAREVVERFGDGVYAVDDEWRVTYWNAEMERRTDIPPGDVLGRSLFEQFPSIRDTELAAAIRDAMGTQTARTVEEFVEAYDGWIESRVFPDQSGVSVYSRDVTERHELERDLESTAQALRSLHKVSADSERSLGGKIEAMLTIGRERLGLPVGYLTRIEDDTREVVYASVAAESLRPDQHRPLAETYCRKSVSQSELLVVHDAAAQGWADDPAFQRSGFSCYVGGSITVDGNRYGTLCFVSDEPRRRQFTDSERAFITLLRQWVSYQLERQQFEQRLRAIQEVTRELMTADDDETIGELAVEATRDLLGLPITAVWRYEDEQASLVPAAVSEEARSVVDATPVFDASTESLAWRAFESGERLVFEDLQSVEGRYNPETDIHSEVLVPLGEYGLLAGGSPQRQQFGDRQLDLLSILAASVESAFERAESDRELRERTAQLRATNERLEKFSGLVAHDLRNPLSVATGFLDIGRESGDDEHLRKVESALDRMADLIDDLLTLARESQVPVDSGPVDLAEVAREAWGFVDTAGASLTVAEALPTVTAGRRQLLELLENCYRNAIEHGGPGVTVTVGPTDGGFFVADDGTGFSEEALARSFEYGYTTSTAGTGFGLAIVETIADHHGWTVTVSNGPDGGARIEFDGVGQSSERR